MFPPTRPTLTHLPPIQQLARRAGFNKQLLVRRTSETLYTVIPKETGGMATSRTQLRAVTDHPAPRPCPTCLAGLARPGQAEGPTGLAILCRPPAANSVSIDRQPRFGGAGGLGRAPMLVTSSDRELGSSGRGRAVSPR